jgi:hypothetical protein
MSYHQQATGLGWAELEPGVQTMLLTFLRGDGIGMLATALAMAILLLVPFRRGESWARWAIAAVGLVWFVPTLFLARSLSNATGAETPWPLVLVVIAFLVLGFLLSGDLTKRTSEG